MANRRSSIKKIRTDEHRREHNTRVKSELRTVIRKVEALIASKKVAEAQKASGLLFSKIDKAVKKGILHLNNASRQKSRFSARLNSLKVK